MRTIKGSKKFSPCRPVILTIGNFDGVHLGHQEILSRVIKKARALRGESVLYTFAPHPAKLIAPRAGLRLLQTEAQKESALRATGLDTCMVEPFTRDFSHITAERFLRNILLKRLSPVHVVIGHDLTFGKRRLGTIETFEKFCLENGIGLQVVEALFYKEMLVSSTQIRKFVAEGKMELARGMLGRPFALAGKVIKGRGIGRKIKVHTANLKVMNEIVPPSGVYVTETLGKRSVTNIGYNPTVGGAGGLSIETHILGFSKNIYGKDIEVKFYERLRPEMLFNDLASLKKQITKDIAEASSYERF
jgi:riboflavin kinase/FMN adenylyltransferase